MLKRPESLFATLVHFLSAKFLLAMLIFGCLNSWASPTQKQTIKKIEPEISDGQSSKLDLEKESTISPSKIDSIQSLQKLSRPHLVHDHYNLGVSLKLGNFYKGQTETSLFGGNFSFTKIVDIENAWDFSASFYMNSWWQILIGKRFYFNDTPYFRPFYSIVGGTQLNPNEYIGGLIVYERYSAGARIGLESIFREVAYCVDAEALLSLRGFNLQTNFTLQKTFN